jgi:hypothetical protein
VDAKDVLKKIEIILIKIKITKNKDFIEKDPLTHRIHEDHTQITQEKNYKI